MGDRPFSQREGHVVVAGSLARNEVTEDLRTGVWNVILARLFGKLAVNGEGRVTQEYHVFLTLHRHFFKAPMDELEKYLASRREWYKDAVWTFEWWRLYDFLEFCARKMIAVDAQEWCREVNLVLEREKAEHRLVGNRIVPLPSPATGESLEDALARLEAREWSSIDGKLRCALEALGTRGAEEGAEGKTVDAERAVREAEGALLACLTRVEKGETDNVEEPNDTGSTVNPGAIDLNTLHAALTRFVADPALVIPSDMRALLTAAASSFREATGPAEAEFRVAFAAAAVTYALRKAEAAGRLLVVPKKVPTDTPPDPWGERRVVVPPRGV